MITMATATSKAEMIANKQFFLDSKKFRVISIICPECDVVFEKDTDHIKTFKFHDVEPVSCLLSIPFKALTFGDAQKIFNFIEEVHNDKEDFRFVVNCTAGICRSGAVVEFIRRFANLDSQKFADDNPNILPNNWVLNSLINCWLEKQDNWSER